MICGLFRLNRLSCFCLLCAARHSLLFLLRSLGSLLKGFSRRSSFASRLSHFLRGLPRGLLGLDPFPLFVDVPIKAHFFFFFFIAFLAAAFPAAVYGYFFFPTCGMLSPEIIIYITVRSKRFGLTKQTEFRLHPAVEEIHWIFCRECWNSFAFDLRAFVSVVLVRFIHILHLLDAHPGKPL